MAGALLVNVSATGAHDIAEQFSGAADNHVGYVVNTVNGQVWLSTDPDFRVAKAATHGKAGRYKIVASASGAYVIDTVLGRVWKNTDPDFRSPKHQVRHR